MEREETTMHAPEVAARDEEGGWLGGLEHALHQAGGALAGALGFSHANVAEGEIGGYCAAAPSLPAAAPAAAPLACIAPEVAPSDGKHGAHAAYASQRDNTFAGAIGHREGVSADNECNVTSLAMQLVTMAGSPAAVNRRTIELLGEAGEKTDAEELGKRQPEDLILRLFQKYGDAKWKELSDAGVAPFYSHKAATKKRQETPSFYEEMMANHTPWHQSSACLQYVGTLYRDFVGGAGSREYTKTKKNEKTGQEEILYDTASKDYFETKLKPVLATGGTVMLGTKLTGGHVVVLTGVEKDGIRINDPYGMNLGEQGVYVRNNEKPSRKSGEYFTTYASQIRVRLSFNDELKAIAGDPERRKQAIPNWGENNFFTWDEVAAMRIGNWNSVLESKQA
jgi:hypothetical protein